MAPIIIFTSRFPNPSETFIHDQANALRARGMDVRVIARRKSAHASRIKHGLETTWLEIGWRSLPVIGALGSAVRLLCHGNAGIAARCIDPRLLGLRALKLHYPVLAERMLDAAPATATWLCHYGHNGETATRLRAIGAISGRIATIFHGHDVARYLGRPNPYPFLAQHGDLFLPVSERWHRELAGWGFPADRLVTCPLGVDIGRFMPHVPASDSQPFRLLSICRLVPKKGLDYAMQALAALPTQILSQVHWRIAGDGEMREELGALAIRLGLDDRVEFLGLVDHSRVPSLMGEADAFLLPSVTAANGDMEGVPISIIEAMAAGLPIISTRHSGIPEVVGDRVHGLLVPERDTAALAKAIGELALDTALRHALGDAGRRRVVAERSQEACSDRLAALLQAPA